MDNLLKNNTINKIAKKTHISPLILEKLFNHDFDKLDIVKLKGFVTILEEEYPNSDFTELKEKIEQFCNSFKEEECIVEEVKESKSNIKVYIGVVLLIIAIIGLVVFMQNSKKTKTLKEVNKATPIEELNITKDENISSNNDEYIEEKESKEKKEINKTLSIIPLQKVWYKATYLDDDKSIEYLTLKTKELNGSKRIFIKFGHGMVKLVCGNNVLEPNSTKVTRVIIDNCDMNITNQKIGAFQ